MFIRVLIIMVLSLSAITFASEPIRVHSQVFEIDGNSEKVFVRGGVKVTKEDAVIHSKRAEYAHDKERISFQEDVVLVKGPIRVESNRLEAYNKTDTIKAVGDVSFNYQDIDGEADRATYSINKELLVLSGNSKARHGKDRISGKRIVIDVRNKRIVTEGRAKIKISPDNTIQKEAR